MSSSSGSFRLNSVGDAAARAPAARPEADATPTVAGDGNATRRPEPALRVVVRLVDGREVELDRFGDEAAARRAAHEFVRSLASEDRTGWPTVGRALVRPSAIVSVDVDDLGGPRWGGSGDRALGYTRSSSGD